MGEAAGSDEKRRRVDPLESLRTPCYIVDVAVARANAAKMRQRFESFGIALRPHVKTHKTIEGALLQTGGDRRRITVSTLAEARFFADAGFDDILYAVPITADKLTEAGQLVQRLDVFHVVVDHPAQVDALCANPPPSKSPSDTHGVWSVVLMVDCGYGRDGVDPEGIEAVALAKRLADGPQTRLAGLYTHGGHSYDATSASAVIKVGEEERDAVVGLARRLAAEGIACREMVAVGSTPTCSNPPASLAGVTEAHPGNYLYYDAMQARLGSCSLEDVAVRVCTRVVGQYPKRNTLLVDVGWTGLSDQGKAHGFGVIEDHPELRINVLKQEAGEVGSADGSPLDYSRYPVGTILKVIPWHSCAATNQHAAVHALEGGKLIGRWVQVRGW